MAEREGFEPSMFSLFSMTYKGIVSRSCLIVLVNHEHHSTQTPPEPVILPVVRLK